jgi:hypothetical protein
VPFFEVRLHCKGIDVPIDGERARGFFTNRVVLAKDPVSAKDLAVKLLHREWRNGRYFALNASATCEIEAEEANSLGLVRALFGRRQSYAFHTEEA